MTILSSIRIHLKINSDLIYTKMFGESQELLIVIGDFIIPKRMNFDSSQRYELKKLYTSINTFLFIFQNNITKEDYKQRTKIL